MLNVDYLRKILRGKINEIHDVNTQIIKSDAGYDGIIALIQEKGLETCIILEDSGFGELSLRPGGFHTTTQSIWIMQMVGNSEDRDSIQRRCFDMMKFIVSVFTIADGMEMKQWNPLSIPYGVRNAGSNYTGYEFTLNFGEDTDLSYQG